MFSGIEKVNVQVVVFPVSLRCQDGASIFDDLNEDVNLSLDIWVAVEGAFSEHPE